MHIHRAGFRVIFEFTVVLAALVVLSWTAAPDDNFLFSVVLSVIAVVLELFVLAFFRVPHRKLVVDDEGAVYAPADGSVVVVERVYEDEYLKDERIQISIFMSLFNVHANFFPISGVVEYFKYHRGSFLVAWHPKSSTENERTSVVVCTDYGHKVMFRQIAGLIARRIVSYSKEGNKVVRGKQCGFIKFGSRVDVFLPLGSHINVQIGDSTIGAQTKIAQLPRCQ